MPENQKEMTREMFLLEMDEILGQRPGTLKGDEPLEELPNFDSTALIQILVLAQEASDKPISFVQVARCSTVGNILLLAGMRHNSFSQRNAQRNRVRVHALAAK